MQFFILTIIENMVPLSIIKNVYKYGQRCMEAYWWSDSGLVIVSEYKEF